MNGPKSSIVQRQIETSKWIKLNIGQREVDAKIMYQIHINGINVYEKENEAPMRHKNVKFYMSGKFDKMALGEYRNLAFRTCKPVELASTSEVFQETDNSFFQRMLQVKL